MGISRQFGIGPFSFSIGFNFGQSVTLVDNGGSAGWDDPDNILSEGSEAQQNGEISSGVPYTIWIVASGPFSTGTQVPSGATITGITVETKWRATGTNLSEIAAGLRLFNGSSTIGSPKAASGRVSSVEQTWTWGSASDVWGAALTPALVNSANFGAGVFFTSNPEETMDWLVSINTIKVKVNYQ